MRQDLAIGDGVRLIADDTARGTLRVRIVPPFAEELPESHLNTYHFLAEPEAEACSGWTIRAEGKKIFFRSSGGMELELDEFLFGKKNFAVSFAAEKEEDWIGFGDLTRDRMYHRGHAPVCWVSNVTSYLPVPFFLSTRGYGILVNTTACVRFDMARHRPDRFAWSDEARTLDFYLFSGKDFKEIRYRYACLTGFPKLPPLWSFGLWYICRMQANSAEVVNDALNFRRSGIPCDLIGLEPGWMGGYDYTTEKKWSKELFDLPDWQLNNHCPTTFIKILKRMGFHLELWLCQNYDLFYEEERRKKRIEGTSGTPETEEEEQPFFDRDNEYDVHFSHGSRFDQWTKPDEPWFEHLKKFVDWGADCFKQDGSNQVIQHPDRLYANGETDKKMHNLYPLCYSRQMWEGFAEYTNRRPLVFTVSGWTGFQSWCGTWTGDTGGGFKTLGAMLNTSVMGHSWCTVDMDVQDKSSIHYGYLQPWAQINSWTYFRMPWCQGDELFAVHQDYSRLRSRLIPYLYSWGEYATRTADPLLRPLQIEFQQDPRMKSVRNAYLLGRDLLVTAFDDKVIFPEGRWKDFWTGQIQEGGTETTITYPANRGGGLFIRENALIPFGPVMQYRGEKPLDELELYLFPAENGSGEFTLYEDDGVTFEYLKGKCHRTEIAFSRKNGELLLSIGPSPKELPNRKWSAVIALDRKPAALPAGVCWDEERKELHLPGLIPGENRITL